MPPKTVCSYGSLCFRKNKAHLDAYSHPEPIPKASFFAPPPAKRQKVKEAEAEEEKTTEKVEVLVKDCDDEEVETTQEEDTLAALPAKVSDVNAVPVASSAALPSAAAENSPVFAMSTAQKKALVFEKLGLHMPDKDVLFWEQLQKWAKAELDEKLFSIGSTKTPAQVAMSALQYFADTTGLLLVGPFDVLAGRMDTLSKSQCQMHYRYWYDPAEVQTVLAKNNGAGLCGKAESDKADEEKDGGGWHACYYRDAPEEIPMFLVANQAYVDGKFVPVGDDVCSCMLTECTKSLNQTGSVQARKKIQKIIDQLQTFAGGKGSSSSGNAEWKKRQKNVVGKTMSGLGVKVEVENDVGYRELPVTDMELRKIFSAIDTERTSGASINYDKFDEMMTYITLAHDECDFGAPLHLALNMLTLSAVSRPGLKFFQQEGVKLIRKAYEHLNRDAFADIIQAHVESRGGLASPTDLRALDMLQ